MYCFFFQFVRTFTAMSRINNTKEMCDWAGALARFAALISQTRFIGLHAHAHIARCCALGMLMFPPPPCPKPPHLKQHTHDTVACQSNRVCLSLGVALIRGSANCVSVSNYLILIGMPVERHDDERSDATGCEFCGLKWGRLYIKSDNYIVHISHALAHPYIECVAHQFAGAARAWSRLVNLAQSVY